MKLSESALNRIAKERAEPKARISIECGYLHCADSLRALADLIERTDEPMENIVKVLGGNPFYNANIEWPNVD